MRLFTLVVVAAGCFPPLHPLPEDMDPAVVPVPDADLAGLPDLAKPVGPQPDLAGADLAGAQPDLAKPDLANVTPPPNLDALSDDFENGFQSSWNVLHPTLIQVSVSGGSLVLTPNQSLWFNGSEGPLVYKTVPAGDFVVTTTLHARKTSNASLPPDGIYSLGGLMARKDGSPENYVFIVLGHDFNDVSIEHKTTTNSVSTYDGPTWPNGDAELRVCRIGTQMRLYKRAVGAGSWTQALAVDRPDLAGDLQVGAVAYANNATPDLTLRYDAIQFAAPAAGDCP